MRRYYRDEMEYDAPEDGYVMCWQHKLVSLQQRGPDDFVVRYGKEVYAELTYAEACAKLGGAIMHALACDGVIDNGEG